MYKQVKPFNQSTATHTTGACLVNVRTGFGIAAKYPCAWANWLNTDQHTSAIPSGVDVPVFFWYLDTSDGHIGVRLANGTFWSDGNIYSSIEAYNAAGHTPSYRGWSTKVEDVAVLEWVADPAPTPAGSHINLPVGSGAWHLYKPGGPYNPNNPADFVAVVHPDLYKPGGLTYPILQKLPNGVFRIQSPSHGVCDLFTNGSSFKVF